MFYFSRINLSFSSTFPGKITIFKAKLKIKHFLSTPLKFKHFSRSVRTLSYEYSQQTPHSSPVRASYGVSFVGTNSNVCDAWVTTNCAQYHVILDHVITAPNWDNSAPLVSHICVNELCHQFQVMACCCLVPSHYLNQCCLIVNWTIGSKIQWNSNKNTWLFFHENVVCEMATILSNRRWVNR